MLTVMVCGGSPAFTDVNGGLGEKARAIGVGATVKVSLALAGFVLESNMAEAFEAAMIMTCALGDGGFGGGV